MGRHSSSTIHFILCACEKLVLRFPWFIIVCTILLCSISLYYTVNNLGVNTNTAEMLSPDLPFQQNRQRINKEFPQEESTIIMVVEAPTPEETSLAANELFDLLQLKNEQFDTAFMPSENDFFRQQALLYLSTEELYDLSKKLTDAQPFIGHLSQNYHLAGLLEIITQALKQTDNSLPLDLNPLLLAITDSLDAQLQQKPHHLSWQNLLAEKRLNTEYNRTIVIAKPKLHFDELLPADYALSNARELARSVMAKNPTVSIRITGETALEHEELESVSQGAAIAGLVSLLLVCLSLWLSYHSFKLLFNTFVALIMGLILTAGFATISIGHLNIISVAFAVLYIGLGVDYAIHICLRYRECRAQGFNNNQAISESIHSVGFSIFLCALTTSIGFLAFIPTDYAGVSELGIISGAGMFIGLGISLTVLPALLTIMPLKNVKPFNGRQVKPSFFATIPFRFSGSIRIISVILGIGSCFILTQLVFDSNPINLRDPKSESVSTIKELLKSQTESPFSLASLADNLDKANELAAKLEKLPSVHETITLSSFVADNQDEKLYIIEDLDMILGAQLKQFNSELDSNSQRQALVNFNKELLEFLSATDTHVSKQILQNLQQRIQNYLEYADNSPAPEAEYKNLEHNILGLLPYTMQRLSASLAAESYSLNDLPDYITSHWVGTNGFYKVLITPEKDQNQIANLKEFVGDVQSIDATTTGLPVSDQASGTAVINAFIEAFSGAFIAIVLLLLIILKNIKNTLLVVGPLVLAALFTGASNVLLDNPFNFANIIALPLLMGMGVDSGIHIMHRLQTGLSNNENLLQTSTARGVFFSSLTTLCSFSSLAFTAHVGTASMGLLLAIGITFTLICTLIVLPAFSGKQI